LEDILEETEGYGGDGEEDGGIMRGISGTMRRTPKNRDTAEERDGKKN